jgi:PAS domain S-box-containing protein
MLNQQSILEEQPYQEALEVLERLAAAGRPGRSPDDAAPQTVPPLPPRSAVLPSWSEQSFRDLVEGLPDAVVVINEAGTIVLVNRQTEKWFGYAREELLGQVIEILVPKRIREVHVGHRRGYLAAPTVRPLGDRKTELFGRRKDGSEFPVEISLSPLHGPDGLLVTSVIRDITDRKRYEAKFRTLVENIPAVMFIAPLDESSPELYVSPQIEDLLGFSQKEWLEDPVLWHRQLHPADRDRWNRHFAPTCASGTPFKAEYRFLAKNGRVVWVHGSANVVRDDKGQLLFLQGIAFDITAIKEAEETLREQARLAVVRADISAAITRADSLQGMLDRCVAALTEDLEIAFARVWIFDETEGLLELIARGKTDTERAVDARRISLGEGEIGLIAAGRQVLCTNTVQGDARIPAQEWVRKEKIVAFAGYPLLIEDRLVGVLALFSRQPLSPATLQTLASLADHVSLGINRLQTEENLRRVNAELERRVQERTEDLTRSLAELGEKTKELDKFAFHATHDLTAPLRTILTHTQKLERQFSAQLPPKGLELIQKVIDGVASMQLLIKKLHDYARVNLEAKLETVDCTAAVVRACSSLQAAIDESEARVEVTTALPTLVGMKEHLELLFQNLISNAIKYRSPDRPPRVEIGAQRHADGWLFWVRDNGIGIEPRFWQKIFGMGVESQLNKRSEYGGFGYGLAICEKTVLRHGGRIWVASELGQGSTFYFTLPEQPPAKGRRHQEEG